MVVAVGDSDYHEQTDFMLLVDSEQPRDPLSEHRGWEYGIASNCYRESRIKGWIFFKVTPGISPPLCKSLVDAVVAIAVCRCSLLFVANLRKHLLHKISRMRCE